MGECHGHLELFPIVAKEITRIYSSIRRRHAYGHPSPTQLRTLDRISDGVSARMIQRFR
jgi:hypothetical protein